MTDWLYPLSSTSGYWFQLPDGSRTKDTSPANFEATVLRGSPDKTWTVARNYKQMKAGDRVCIYYGTSDGDLGIVGLATVTSVDPPADGRADAHLRWDKRRTRNLLTNPLPAREVRRFILRPRAAVENLSNHPQLVRRLERHTKSSPTKAKMPGAERAKTSTITYCPPRKVTVYRRHDALIWPVQTRLETCGWAKIVFDVRPRRVDLAMGKRKVVLLIEFKTVARSASKAVREAFAQLCEYDWRHGMLHPRDTSKVHRWAVFERQPSKDDVRFLEDSRILVSWANSTAKRLIHGKETRERLIELSVAP